MKDIVGILKQFTRAQRLLVLILLLSFTTGTYLLSQYLKTDDCRPVIEENLKMQQDFVKIAEMLRKERLKEFEHSDSTAASQGPEEISTDNKMVDQILQIAESHR